MFLGRIMRGTYFRNLSVVSRRFVSWKTLFAWVIPLTMSDSLWPSSVITLKTIKVLRSFCARVVCFYVETILFCSAVRRTAFVRVFFFSFLLSNIVHDCGLPFSKSRLYINTSRKTCARLDRAEDLAHGASYNTGQLRDSADVTCKL